MICVHFTTEFVNLLNSTESISSDFDNRSSCTLAILLTVVFTSESFSMVIIKFLNDRFKIINLLFDYCNLDLVIHLEV